jgi:hypothetical protein
MAFIEELTARWARIFTQDGRISPITRFTIGRRIRDDGMLEANGLLRPGIDMRKAMRFLTAEGRLLRVENKAKRKVICIEMLPPANSGIYPVRMHGLGARISDSAVASKMNYLWKKCPTVGMCSSRSFTIPLLIFVCICYALVRVESYNEFWLCGQRIYRFGQCGKITNNFAQLCFAGEFLGMYQQVESHLYYVRNLIEICTSLCPFCAISAPLFLASGRFLYLYIMGMGMGMGDLSWLVLFKKRSDAKRIMVHFDPCEWLSHVSAEKDLDKRMDKIIKSGAARGVYASNNDI